MVSAPIALEFVVENVRLPPGAAVAMWSGSPSLGSRAAARLIFDVSDDGVGTDPNARVNSGCRALLIEGSSP
jgi:hypothetical protein